MSDTGIFTEEGGVTGFVIEGRKVTAEEFVGGVQAALAALHSEAAALRADRDRLRAAALDLLERYADAVEQGTTYRDSRGNAHLSNFCLSTWEYAWTYLGLPNHDVGPKEFYNAVARKRAEMEGQA